MQRRDKARDYVDLSKLYLLDKSFLPYDNENMLLTNDSLVLLLISRFINYNSSLLLKSIS